MLKIISIAYDLSGLNILMIECYSMRLKEILFIKNISEDLSKMTLSFRTISKNSEICAYFDYFPNSWAYES